MADRTSDSIHWQQGARECYTIQMDTVNESRSHASLIDLARELLGRVADKWTLEVIDALEGGEPVRFTRLQQMVDGVSQKMLTKTLRQLERDGLVIRRVTFMASFRKMGRRPRLETE